MHRLEVYETLLRERTQTLSLVGRATLDMVWERHFLDSAQLWPLITNRTVLDMGTGAGFPGMVLAIMGAPDVHLSENNQQKVAFLKLVAERTETRVVIHNCKAEALHGSLFDNSVITARAVAPLADLLQMGRGLFTHGAEGLFLKGRAAVQEVEEARKSWDFDLETTPSFTSPESSILHLTRIRPRV